MVDTENPVLAEGRPHRLIDGAGAFQVLADGLFHHHPRGRRRQPRRAEVAADGAVQAGRDRQVIDRPDNADGGHARADDGDVVGLGGVRRAVEHPRQQPLSGAAGQGFRGAGLQILAHHRAEGLVVHRRAAHRQHRQTGGQQALALQIGQGRQQHAQRQVAAAAEQDKAVSAGAMLVRLRPRHDCLLPNPHALEHINARLAERLRSGGA